MRLFYNSNIIIRINHNWTGKAETYRSNVTFAKSFTLNTKHPICNFSTTLCVFSVDEITRIVWVGSWKFVVHFLVLSLSKKINMYCNKMSRFNSGIRLCTLGHTNVISPKGLTNDSNKLLLYSRCLQNDLLYICR